MAILQKQVSKIIGLQVMTFWGNFNSAGRFEIVKRYWQHLVVKLKHKFGVFH